jgi:hypothetical protein
MKMVLAVLLVFGAFAQAEGLRDDSRVSQDVLDAQGRGSSMAASETADNVTRRIADDRNPWINQTELDRQGRGLSAGGHAAIVQYKGCYTTYKTWEKAQRNCPPGAIAVEIFNGRGLGYTCQCSIDAERGGGGPN